MNIILLADTETTLSEFLNGVWAVSTLALLALVSWALVAEIREDRNWYRNPGAQISLALIVLMTGLLMRSLSEWLLLRAYNHGIDPLIDQWVLLLTTTAVATCGKMACIFALSPRRWRSWLVAGAAVVSLLLPAFTLYFVVLPDG